MIKTLLGIRFRAFLSTIGGKNKKGEQKPISKGKVVLMGVLYLYLAVCFGVLSALFAYAIGSECIRIGEEWLFFSLFMALPFFMVLLFSIFEMKAEIFESRDNGILIPLPIPAEKIVLSRVLTVLIFNYLESSVFVLPAYITYLIIGGHPSYFFGGLLVSLFIPLLATAVSSVIGYAVAVIASHMKRKNIATLLISLLFLGAYFYFYTRLMSGEGDIASTAVSWIPILERYRALKFIGESAMWQPLSLAVVVCLSVGAFALTYYFISRNFMRLVTRAKSVKHTYKEKKQSVKSPFFALCGKEFSRFFSSANYMLNASMGVIMSVVLAVVAFTKRAIFSELSEMLELNSGLYYIVLMAIVSVSNISSISASSVSLEGKNLWLVRSLPVSSKTVLLAKAVPHFLISAPISAACGVFMFAIVPGTRPFDLIFAVVLPLSASLAMSLLGVAVNVWLPKFDWVNEMAVVKQSTPVMIFTLVPTLVGILLVGGAVLLSTFGFGILAPVFGFALFSSVAAVSYFLLCGPCAEKFDTFS